MDKSNYKSDYCYFQNIWIIVMLNKNIKKLIDDHLNGINLDIRKSNYSRFMDQKCTADMLTAVAEIILEYIGNDTDKTFTIRDIWSTEFANEIMTNSFRKPDVNNPAAKSEYDKVFSQPIKLLHYAQIINFSHKEKNKSYYIVNREDILNYIAISDNKSLNFLTTYLQKVLIDSDIYYFFEYFFAQQTKQSFNELKDNYTNFIIDNTPINGKTEIYRIFTKILNPLAFKNRKRGTKGGNISEFPIQYNELFYNRINFRDIEKPKDKTRNEYLELLGESGPAELYQIDKAKRQIKKYHCNKKSEIHKLMHENATHVHHIFTKREFPELSDTLENLILLTPTQHLSFAHTANNTNIISKSYQLICLLYKLDSIEESEYSADEFYSLNQFKNIVNSGLGKELLTLPMTYQDIKNSLAIEYCS